VYRSPSYASQRSKSAFVEMSERSAETARLLQQAREAQPQEPRTQGRSLAHRTASQLDHLLQRLGKSVAQPRGEVRS
jgi:hypothetical protein